MEHADMIPKLTADPKEAVQALVDIADELRPESRGVVFDVVLVISVLISRLECADNAFRSARRFATAGVDFSGNAEFARTIAEPETRPALESMLNELAELHDTVMGTDNDDAIPESKGPDADFEKGIDLASDVGIDLDKPEGGQG